MSIAYELMENLNRLHTTQGGLERIRRNLSLDTEDVVGWCKAQITRADAKTIRLGKNWYVCTCDGVITINASSYTIITASKEGHKLMSKLDQLCAKAEDMLNSCQTVEFATINEQGFPRVCTLSKIKSEGWGVIYFATAVSSVKVRCLLKNPKSSACYHLGNNSQTLLGYAEVLTDAKIKSELWQDWFINHFKGVDDPDYCIVKFTAEQATLWYDGEFVTFSR